MIQTYVEYSILRVMKPLYCRCHAAALKSAAAAGPLGVSRQEAARRGAEVDRMLRQREESSLSTMQGCSSSVKALSSFSRMKEANAEGSETAVSSRCGVGHDARDSRKNDVVVPRLGKLEDRQVSTTGPSGTVLHRFTSQVVQYFRGAGYISDRITSSSIVTNVYFKQIN